MNKLQVSVPISKSTQVKHAHLVPVNLSSLKPSSSECQTNMSSDTQNSQILHTSVLLDEALHWWCEDSQASNGVFVDCTFGRGGHSRELLKKLSNSDLIVFDKDPSAIDVAQQLQAEVSVQGNNTVHIVHDSFAQIAAQITFLGRQGKIDGILMDLGVSSPQLDEAERGFSFMRDGPLDMRMDYSQGETAAEWLATVDEKTLADIIYQYGEEKQSRRIAKKIVAARAVEPITTTAQLADLVCQIIPRRVVGKHPATRTFQAIRMHINSELDDLKNGLAGAYEMLAPGGRLVVLSFHSIEDRIVKRYMQSVANPPQLPRGLPIRDAELAPKAKFCVKSQKPQSLEVSENPRARSAILRVIEKKSD